MPESPPAQSPREATSIAIAALVNRRFFQLCRRNHVVSRFETERIYVQARRDAEWSVRAAYAMAEVYLNPENENLWEEGQSDAGGKVGPGDNAEATKAAKKLLQEVSGRNIIYAARLCFPRAAFNMVVWQLMTGAVDDCFQLDKETFYSPELNASFSVACNSLFCRYYTRHESGGRSISHDSKRHRCFIFLRES